MAIPEKYTHGITVAGEPAGGDAGKGKLTDVLAQEVDVSVRVGGGSNAGHTVVNEHGTFKFHLMPSGIFSPRSENFVATGVLVNPNVLSYEITMLQEQQIPVGPQNLRISREAHGVFEWHKELDRIGEEARGDDSIGTTLSGNGPAAAQRAAREGIRMVDFLQPEESFINQVDAEIKRHERLARVLKGELFVSDLKDVKFKKYSAKKLRKLTADAAKDVQFNRDEIMQNLLESRNIILPLIGDVTHALWLAQDEEKDILLEMAQGMLLDPMMGTYPFVTSTHPGLAGVTESTGIQGRDITKAIAVVKAYATRVGKGPMPTEFEDATANLIREKGKEYGTTTGRPRRIGWIDIPVIRHGMRAGGFDRVALTKGDILDGLDEIKVGVGYVIDGMEYTDIPSMDPAVLDKAVPTYASLKGWQKDTAGAQSFEGLPDEAQEYVLFLENEIGVPIDIVSVGPDREQTIFRAA